MTGVNVKAFPGSCLSAVFSQAKRGMPNLKVGLWLDSWVLPACWAAVLSDVFQADFLTVERVYIGNPHQLPGRDSLSLSLAIYGSLARAGASTQPDPLAAVDCSHLLSGCPIRELNTMDDARLVNDVSALDVLLKLSMDVEERLPMFVAKHGIWSFKYGDRELRPDAVPYIAEKVLGADLCLVSFDVRKSHSSERAADAEIARCIFSTDAADDPYFNHYGPMWGSVHLALRSLRYVYLNGGLPQLAGIDSAALMVSMKAYDQLMWAVSGVCEKVGRKLGVLPSRTIDHWQVGIRNVVSSQYAHEMRESRCLGDFQWLQSPKGHFWADPFLFSEQGKTWLFFEDLNYANWHGTLWVVELSDKGVGEARPCLSCSYHLSYPQVFRSGGAIYMVPETSASGEIELYRARKFPYEWERVKTLVSLRAVDTTLVNHHDQWWMYTTAMPIDSHAITNLLFCADDLLGEWRLVETSSYGDDVRSARGAGAFVGTGGRLLRPSQDCGGRYGKRVLFNQVDMLSEQDYRESFQYALEPAAWQNCVGIHTYNCCDEWEVIDACFRTPAREVM